MKASPKTLLAASVTYDGSGQLKVYYNRDGDSMMWCAWVNLNGKSWATKKINEKY